MPSESQILAQNGYSRSFWVIDFDVVEKPLKDYILQRNNYGLVCEISEDIVSERSENRHFRRSYLTSPPANPYEYPHISYLARNQDP